MSFNPSANKLAAAANMLANLGSRPALIVLLCNEQLANEASGSL